MLHWDFFGWHQDDFNNLTNPLYHANPKSLTLPLNITPSPNMSITLESSNINNTIIDINSFIFLNGTVLSRGLNPSSLNGTLSLDMRRSDMNGPYVNLKKLEFKYVILDK